MVVTRAFRFNSCTMQGDIAQALKCQKKEVVASPKNGEKVRVGISSCLLGEKVRWNGDHKEDRYVTGTLAQCFEWVAVCPEVEIGLGTPRETIQLVGDPETPRLKTTRTDIDLTNQMLKYARRKVRELEALHLSGYILKKDSPSCGMQRVRVYNDSGMPVKKGVGVFARVLMDHLPFFPVEEEGRLKDRTLRENFIVRVFCYRRWQAFMAGNWQVGDLVSFPHLDVVTGIPL